MGPHPVFTSSLFDSLAESIGIDSNRFFSISNMYNNWMGRHSFFELIRIFSVI